MSLVGQGVHLCVARIDIRQFLARRGQRRFLQAVSSPHRGDFLVRLASQIGLQDLQIELLEQPINLIV